MADGSVTIEVELTKEQLEKGLKSIKSDLGNLQKSTNGISDKLAKGFDSIGKASTKAGKILTLGLTTPLTALATAGVKYNMSMETYLTNLTVLLQGNQKEAEKLLTDLKQMAKTTPFETSNLVKATQTMMSFGISAKDSQKYLKQLGDISMGDANKLDSLTLAFSQVSSGGKLSGQDLLQMINAGFNPLNIISQKTGKSMATLKDEMSKGAISAQDVAQAFEWATQEGGLFYQGMDKGAQTTEGKISTLKDAFSELVGGLTEAFLPTVTKAVEKLTGLIDKFNNLDPAVKENVAKILLIVASLGPVLLIFGKVSSAIGTLIKVFTTVKGAIALMSGPIKGATTAMKALSAVFSFITSPIGLIVIAITALIGILIYLWNTNEGFRNAVIGAWNAIKESAIAVWNWIVKLFTETIPNAWNEFIKGIQNFATTIWNTLVKAWNSIVSFFTEGIPNFIKSVIQWFQELPYKIGYFIGEILGNIIKFGQNAWNWVTIELPKIIKGIIDWFAKLPSNIWNWLVNTFNKIVQWGQNTYNAATQWISNTINAIVKWFQELPGRVWTWLQNTINNVINWGRDIAEKGKQGAINLFNNIINTIKELPQRMLDIGKNIVEGLWNGIINAKNWIVNKVKSFAKGILDGMKNALGIHSPSRVFRDEVGKYIALGVGEGFTKNIDSVYKKMKSTVDFETQKLNANLTSNAIVEVQRNANIQSRLESIDNNKEIVVKAETNLDGKVLTSTVNRVNAKQKLQYGIA